MGLFSWFKKKQIEAQTSNYAIGIDPYREGNLDTPLGGPDREKKDSEALALWPEMGRNDHEGDFHEAVVPFKIKAIFSNRVLTVFLPGGEAIVNTGATKELFQKVSQATSVEEVKGLMLDKEALVAEIKKHKEVENLMADQELVRALPEFVETGDFNEKDGALYLNGIDVSIPRLLAREILKAGKMDNETYYESLKNFWCWCVLNPDKVPREDLFGFLERGDFKITRNGFFLGYRNVVQKDHKKDKDASLTAFISDKYLNIKTKQKKNPKNYFVHGQSDGTYSLWKVNGGNDNGIVLGNLADLYNNLSTLEDNEYTDKHTGKMSIKIGVPVKMEREKCDNDPHSECSRGLHVGNKSFGYQDFGNITILVAINPMNVVAVPSHDTNKMRVCEYMPLGVLEGKERDWLEDADSLSIEEEYGIEEAKNLLKLAQSSGAEETKTKTLLGGGILVSQVAKTLDIRAAISGRVKQA